MRRSSTLLVLSAALYVQAGCAGGALNPPAVAGSGPAAVNNNVRGYLYVSNRPAPSGSRSGKMQCPTWISVYRAGDADLVDKLPGLCKGTDGDAALAFDQDGNAYWADYFNGAVLVFAPGKTKPLYTIALGASYAYSLAIDGSGRLYVANLGPVPTYGTSSVSVYARGEIRPSYTITDGVTYPTYLTVSGSGELFVANCPYCTSPYYGSVGPSNVALYAPGKKVPSRVLLRGIDQPSALALDGAGNLYVANECAPGGCSHGSVTVYPPKAAAPSLTITHGLNTPSALTVGTDGTLYVADRNSVVEFAKGKKTPEATITIPGCKAAAVTLDASGDLYVLMARCNASSHTPLGAVAVYSPGKTKPVYTITKGIDDPQDSFAIAP